MATDFDNVNTLCPFYISEDRFRISCEGITDGSTVRLFFSTRAGKQEYKDKYCNKKYCKCKIHKILMEKYL